MENTDSINELIKTRQKFLNFLRKNVKEQDIQDILHNALIKAGQNLCKFHGKAKLSTWFTAILHNLIYDHYNYQRQFEQLQPENIEHNSYQTFERSLSDELKCLLQKAINSLSNDNQREIIKLRYYEHLKLSHIHKILGTNYKAAEMQHRRALQCLRYLILKDPCYKGLVEYAKAKGLKKC